MLSLLPLLAALLGGATVPMLGKAEILQETQVRRGLPNFHAKASAGKTVRVAFLGGSITAAEGWRPRTLRFLEECYPQAKMEEIFAAVSGTGSPLGAMRFERDVRAKRPDLLFVEFAVNDGALPAIRIEEAMEGIVRKLWQGDPRADICFVYTLSKKMVEDYAAGRLGTSAAAMERVARHYGIPSIAFGPDVARHLDSGRWVFQAGKKAGITDEAGRTIFSHDGIHPLEAGHALYAGTVMRAWPLLVNDPKGGIHEMPPPLHAGNWEKAEFIPTDRLTRTGEWRSLPNDDKRVAADSKKNVPPTWWTETSGSAVEGLVTGSTVGIYGLKSARSGRFRVTVDDLPPVEATLRDAFSTAGRFPLKAWFHPATLSPGHHRVRVELLPGSAGSADEIFICGFVGSGDSK